MARRRSRDKKKINIKPKHIILIGAIAKNGLEMLHLQAVAAWNIWNVNQ